MHDTEQIIEQLRSLPRDRGVSEDYIQLRIDLYKAQAATLGKAPDATLTSGILPWENGLGLELFDSLLDACRRNGQVDVQRLRRGLHDSDDRLQRLVCRVAMDNQSEYLEAESKRLATPSDLLLFLARLTAAPFATYAVQSSMVVNTGASHGFCPMCGSTPGLASLDADHHSRRLHCSLCGWSWSFGRLACPFCEGSGSDELDRLSIDETPGEWIEACGVCRHYLKTFDASDLVPLAREVGSLALDALAERQGYAAKPPYAAVG